MSSITRIDQLIHELDVVYQGTLDRLEVQARDAVLIDKALRQILDQGDEADAVLNWNPERAISPRGAFRALANQVVKAAQTTATREDTAITTLDYEDLLSWPDEPKRLPGEAPSSELFRRIAYARNKSLRKFWNSFVVRIAPDRDPATALMTAASDLATAFGIEAPTHLLLPFRHQDPFRTLLFPFNRSQGDLEWTVHQPAMLNLIRANHALSTICRVNGDGSAATAIHELNGNLQSRMKTSFRQYKPRDSFIAGDLLNLQFGRDHVDFQMGVRVWELVWQALPEHVPELQFVDAPNGL